MSRTHCAKDGVLLYENDSLMALSEAEQASGASGFESTSLASMNGTWPHS